MDFWINAFKTTLPPIFTLGVMIGMGVFLARRHVLDAHAAGILTRLVVRLLLPMLLFSKLVKQFRPEQVAYARWYLLPLGSWGVLLCGYAAGWLAHRCFAGGASPARRTIFATLAGWQNAGYVPIPIIAALYAGAPATRDRMLVYCFLFILGFSPTMWSLGPLNLARASRREGERLDWRKMITPPFVANLSGIALCLLGLPQRLPRPTLEMLLRPLEMVGDACIPIIMVLLGAMLARPHGAVRIGARFVLGLIGVKLILMPAAMGGLILLVGERWTLPAGFLALFFIEAASPPATGLTVIARQYGGAEQSALVNKAILWSYLAAALLLPVWLAIGRAGLGLFAE